MAPIAESGPLRGRAAEIAAVERLFAFEPASGIRIMLVEGEAGIGKTRLLEVATDAAGARGLAVFAGICDQLERDRPFGPLVDALRLHSRQQGQHDSDWSPVLDERHLAGGTRGVALARGVALSRDPDLQFLMIDAIVDAVEEVALGGPVALVFDDLHWADHSTLLAINSITRRLAYLQIAVLATLRSGPHSAALAQTVDGLVRRGAQRLMLAPLDDEAVAEIVIDQIGVPAGPTLASAVSGTAGNPLYVVELLQALRQSGNLSLVEDRAELTGSPMPVSLRATILSRLGVLGEPAVDLLLRLSVLGSAFSLRDAATAVGVGVTELTGMLRGLLAAGVLVESGRGLEFHHDLVREALYDDLLEDARAAMHLEAGQRLADAGADALLVARHLMLGAQTGDSDAAVRLQAAARAVARRAPSTAVQLLERSLELAGESHTLRLPILADLVPTLLWSGRPVDAEARAREGLIAAGSSELEGTLRLGLAQALSVQGRFSRLIEDVAQYRPEDGDPDLMSQLLAESANAAALLGQYDEATALAQESVAVGSPALSEGAESGLLVLSDLARGRCEFGTALALAESALERSRQRGGMRRGWRPEIFIAMALRSLDRFTEAEEAIQRGRRVDENLGLVSFLPVYSYELATGYFHAGRWSEAVAEAETGLALADEVGLVMLRGWPRSLLALIALYSGDFDAAAGHLEADDGPRDPGHSDRQVPNRSPRSELARALLLEASGDVSNACAILEATWDRDRHHGPSAARALIAPDLVRLALATGAHARAARTAKMVATCATAASVPSIRGAALRCRGLVENDAEALVAAVDAYAQGPRAFDHALACEEAAPALARAGLHEEASATMDRALDAFARMGARHALARALATARDLGIIRRRRGPRTRATYGWRALTPSEYEVVLLAADGLTNPEIAQRLFISRRTVQTHLSNAFRKLEVRSRVELAAQAARHRGIGVQGGGGR